MRTEFKKITCVGSGVIGMSWALKFAWMKRQVSVYDINDEVLEKAKGALERSLESLKELKLVDDAECEAIKSRIAYTTDLAEALKDTDYVQESGPENIPIKQQIIANIEAVIPDDVVIASSSSSLPVSDIAAKAAHPERIVLGHPVNPPHLIPAVELVRSEKCSDEAIANARQFYIDIGMEPVVINKEVVGYIFNRLHCALYREVISMVMKGIVSIEDADKALTWGPGLRWAFMGHNLVWHLGAGEQGDLSVFLTRFKPALDGIMKTLDNMTELPQEYIDTCVAGVEEEIKNLPDEMGKSVPEIIKYRDEHLVALLKLRNKM